MKSRYIAVIIVFSIFINLISVNDFLLVMSSLLLLLLVFISNLYVKLVLRAQKVKESDRIMIIRYVAGYGANRSTRITNRIAIIFSLTIIYLMGAAAFILQWNDMSNGVGHFFLNGKLARMTQELSGLGWTLFVVSLLLETIHVIQLMRSNTNF